VARLGIVLSSNNWTMILCYIKSWRWMGDIIGGGKWNHGWSNDNADWIWFLIHSVQILFRIILLSEGLFKLG
jgi:hypothetical protein